MNNTTNLAIAAILIATTLVVGTFATTTIGTQSAFAYQKKKGDKGNGNGNGNANTITTQKCKQAATQSGFDNDQSQECENLICTHPGNNATCTQEGVTSTSTPTPTPTPTPEPTTTTLRVIKKVVCQPTDSNCSLPNCRIEIISPPSFQIQSLNCEDAIRNGVLVTLQPGQFFTVESISPGFDPSRSGDCDGTIAEGQHLTCTFTNTERPTTGTLLVRKLCVIVAGVGCNPNFHFPIVVTGNNNPQPQPSTFDLTPDSSKLVTMGPGTYTITEGTPAGVPITATFSANCMQSGLLSATGTISAGEDQTCTINNLNLRPPPG
jgi:hypothetical protein